MSGFEGPMAISCGVAGRGDGPGSETALTASAEGDLGRGSTAVLETAGERRFAMFVRRLVSMSGAASRPDTP